MNVFLVIKTTQKGCPGYDTESKGEVLVFETWGVWGTIYQPLRSGRIWHKVNF